jgi:hypothetical protein
VDHLAAHEHRVLTTHQIVERGWVTRCSANIRFLDTRSVLPNLVLVCGSRHDMGAHGMLAIL